MINILYAGLGGFIGSSLRYGVGSLFQKIVKNPAFPFHTMFANVLGCFIIGIIGKWTSSREVPNQALSTFLMVGILGGFTTFSAFGYETLLLIKEGRAGAAAMNVGLRLGLGLICVWLGYSIIK